AARRVPQHRKADVCGSAARPGRAGDGEAGRRRSLGALPKRRYVDGLRCGRAARAERRERAGRGPACGTANLPGVDEWATCQGSLMQEDVPQPRTGVERTIMVDPIVTLHSPKPEVVTPETSLAAVVRHMRETNIGYVLVVDENGKLAGILTER